MSKTPRSPSAVQKSTKFPTATAKMYSKPVAVTAFLWLLAATSVQLSSAAQDTTHEDIRTAIYSFAHTLRDNVDKLERHERREKQSGEQIQNMLLTIVNKQREQYQDDRELEMALKGLAQGLNELTSAQAEQSVDRANTKELLQNLANTVVAGENGLMSMLKEEQKSANKLYRSFDEKLSAVSAQMSALQSRFDVAERTTPPPPPPTAPSQAYNDVVLEAIQKLMDQGSAASAASAAAQSAALNDTTAAQLKALRETGSALTDALRELSDRLDEGERKRAAFEARLSADADAAEAFREDARHSFQLVSAELKTLPAVEKVLVQTADNVLDAKRRVEYGTHQILMEVAAVVNDRAREHNESLAAGLELATRAVLDAQSAVMANLSVKIETEISQVWRQIGIMYQTLTDSASALAALRRQTDAFVNGTAAAVDGMDGKVSAIGGRMAEVDENLNYLLGRLSLVTQEFGQIKIGLGEALESVRLGLQTVQMQQQLGGNKTAAAADAGPGPNPIDEEPLSENFGQNVLSKTVYTVS